MLQLQVMGNSGAGPFRGAACTGYVVSSAGTRILIDCGPGVATALSRAGVHLDAIFITHLHADHCFDLIPLAMSLRVQNGVSSGRILHGASDGGVQPIPVYMRPGGREIVQGIESFFPVRSAAPFASLTGGLLEFREWSDTEGVTVGALRVQPFPVQHSVPAVGMVISDSESRLAFTGDTGLFDGLVAACTGADAILSEASLIAKPSQRQHMSARDAGELAQRAGVDLLILTHFVEGGEDVEAQAMALAAERYTGKIVTTISSPTINLGEAVS
ncbi:MBL fold metallo-hydrolase [Aminobacter sp. HY435]|uniref:MBL fold metallo-hydrolase n=1 Tax=Aminobacter sp. HY435 TaxID=2970917 RepID=UPI0022B9A795|nr:MBL fold metallo-hydrolase [Aminobacter sp. HY435]